MAVKERIIISADNRTARAFKEVQRSARKTADDLGAMSLKLAGIATVGAAAAGALFLMTKRAVDNASALGDAADKIGLNVESLQELRFAAEQAGVEQKTLDMAMQRFSRRVGEAVQGQGELKATLEQYNIAVTDAEGRTRNLEDVLGDYADAVANAGSQQEQLRLAFKGFDSEGAALVNMLREGKDGLDAMRREAQNLGIVLSEDAVQNADAASDALRRMDQVISVSLQRALIDFAPVIENLAIQFATAAPRITEFADAIIKLLFGVEALSLDGLRSEVRGINDEIDGLLESRQSLADMTQKEAEQYTAGLLVKVKTLQLERDGVEALIVAREKEAEVRAALFEFDSASGNTVEATVDNERKRAEALLLTINETNLRVLGADELLLEQRHEKEMAALFALFEAKTISTEEFNEASLAAQDTFEQRKLELLDSRLAEENDLREFYRRQDLDAERNKNKAEHDSRKGLHAGLEAIAALQNVQSRKAFEIGKAAAASLALVKTYEGAQNVFASAASWGPAGWILAPVAAAAAVVTGLANVRSILSTSYGGGGGGGGGHHGGGFSGGSIPSVPDVPALAPPADSAPLPQNLFITIDSEATMVSTEWVRDNLLPSIGEALGDGYNLTVT